jgi:glycosyltransferase involved in cell wall biosynthesis
MKIAIITHDSHIDHRVLTLGSLLKEKDHEVKLFVGYNNVFDKEPSWVLRPDVYISIDWCELLASETLQLEALEPSAKRVMEKLLKIQVSPGNQKKGGLKVEEKFTYVIKNTSNGKEITVWSIDKEYSLYFKEKDSHVLKTYKNYPEVYAWGIYYYTQKKCKTDEATLRSIRQLAKADGILIDDRETSFNCINIFNSFKAQKFNILEETILIKQDIESSHNEAQQWNLKDKDDLFVREIYDFKPILRRVNYEIEKGFVPDLVIVADLPTLPIGIELKERFSIPLIVDCHEWWMGQSVLWEPWAQEKIKIIDYFERLLYPLCDVRITVGQELAEYLENYFKCSFATIYTSGYYIESKDSKDGDGAWLKRQLKLKPTSKICIFQGSLTTNRNIESLIETAKFLEEEIYFVIVGHGQCYDMFVKQAQDAGVSDKVKFCGWVAQEELLKYTAAADLGIIPYVALDKYYSMSAPNKLAEYYQVHIPIIADSSMKEISRIIVQDKIGLLIDFKDPQEIGSTINKLFSEPDTLKEYKNNYKHIDRFSPNQYKKTVEKIFNPFLK